MKNDGILSLLGIAKKAGKVVITATSKDNSSIRARCTILIRDYTVNSGNSEGVGFIDWN